MSETVLNVCGLQKSYGQTRALDGVNLEIGAGEIVGLLGPNGAGKTTLVSIIAGLIRADAGSVSVNGIDALSRSSAVRNFIGFIPQEIGVYPTITAKENLTYFGRLNGVAKSDLPDRIRFAADALQITPLLDKRVASMSGGEKRRLHTATGLLHHPPLLLMDEVSAGADATSRNSLINTVETLASDGAAICYCTHYMAEMESVATRVVIIDMGQIIAHGTVAELLATSGLAVVEAVFDGDAPPYSALQEEVVRKPCPDGEMVRVTSDDPGQMVARLIREAGPAVNRLKSLDVAHPTLETVYLKLTGRRYEPGDATQQ